MKSADMVGVNEGQLHIDFEEVDLLWKCQRQDGAKSNMPKFTLSSSLKKFSASQKEAIASTL